MYIFKLSAGLRGIASTTSNATGSRYRSCPDLADQAEEGPRAKRSRVADKAPNSEGEPEILLLIPAPEYAAHVMCATQPVQFPG